jgi:hypothetical protein
MHLADKNNQIIQNLVNRQQRYIKNIVFSDNHTNDSHNQLLNQQVDLFILQPVNVGIAQFL